MDPIFLPWFVQVNNKCDQTVYGTFPGNNFKITLNAMCKHYNVE